jgi:hypothetical protein
MRLDDIATSAMNGRRIWPRYESEHERRLHLMWLILVAREHRKRVLNMHIILIACVSGNTDYHEAQKASHRCAPRELLTGVSNGESGLQKEEGGKCSDHRSKNRMGIENW